MKVPVDIRAVRMVAQEAFDSMCGVFAEERGRALTQPEWACVLADLRGRIDGVFQEFVSDQDPPVLDALDEATVQASKRQIESRQPVFFHVQITEEGA